MPQQFPNSLTTNTNFSPQLFNESGAPDIIAGFEKIGGTSDNIIWDDGIETGNLEYNEIA